MRPLRSLAAAALASALGVACAPPAPDPAPPDADGPRTGGDLIVALGSDPDSWNPYTTRDATTASVLELLYPRLVHETPDSGRFEPWLARDWSYSDDRRTLTFRLRRDAVWTDGSSVDCEDVRFTYTVQTDERLGWSGREYKKRIVGVECPDPWTTVFRFVEAHPDQMLDANDNAIVPAVYGEVPPDAWRATVWEDRAITCGPYRIASVTPGQDAVLERDPSWWAAEDVRPDRIVLRVFGEAATAVDRWLDGEVDVLRRVPSAQAAIAETRADLQIVHGPSMSYTFLAWNVLEPGAYMRDRAARGCAADGGCDESIDDLRRLRAAAPHPVLADPAVRVAFDHVIDRRDLIEGPQGGSARELHTPIVSSLWAHADLEGRPYDPAIARSMLEAAGWTDVDGDGVRERDGVRLRLAIVAYASNPAWVDAAERIAASLRLVGVDATVEPLARGEFLRRVWDKDFDAAISAWRAGSRVEPQMLFHSRAALERGNNIGAWSTPESDALLERGASALTRDAALPVWIAWQRHFQDQAPYAILYEHRDRIGLSARVRDATPTALDPFRHMHRWWIVADASE